MNPYTYHKRRAAKPKPAGPFEVGLNGLAAFAQTTISPLMAFAMVLLAASAVTGITALASVEMGSNEYAPVTKLFAHAAQTSDSMVLGDSTSSPVSINDAALEAGDPSGTLSMKPLSFDSATGRWNFSISYKVKNATSVVIRIGTYKVAENLSGNGEVQTGTILKPNFDYFVSFWATDASGAAVKLFAKQFHTPKGKQGSDAQLQQKKQDDQKQSFSGQGSKCGSGGEDCGTGQKTGFPAQGGQKQMPPRR